MRRITAKEKKAVEGLLEGKTKRQAINEAYNCKRIETADYIGQKVFKRPQVLKEIEKYEEKYKELTPKAITVIERILNAKPGGVLTWDTQRKTAENIINKSVEDKANTKRENIIQFIKQFQVKESN